MKSATEAVVGSLGGTVVQSPLTPDRDCRTPIGSWQTPFRRLTGSLSTKVPARARLTVHFASNTASQTTRVECCATADTGSSIWISR